MPVTRAPFGVTGDGQAVEVWTLTRGALEAEILTFGAAVRALRVPDRDGKALDVVLGYDTLAEYERNGGYLGALVGRYANRIAKARCLIDGAVVPLEASEGENQLHGGVRGFSYRVFQAEAAGDSALRLTYTAADGEGGFPGALTLTATYTLTDRGLRLRYEAVSDKATYCNITNHSYFNLNGGGDAMGHRLWLASHQFTPVGGGSIPTAMSAPVSGTPWTSPGKRPWPGTSARTASSSAWWAATTTTSFWTPPRACAWPPGSPGTGPASPWRSGPPSPGSSSTPPTSWTPAPPARAAFPSAPGRACAWRPSSSPTAPTTRSGATSSSAPADGTTTPPNTGSGRIDKNSPGWKHFPARLRL